MRRMHLLMRREPGRDCSVLRVASFASNRRGFGTPVGGFHNSCGLGAAGPREGRPSSGHRSHTLRRHGDLHRPIADRHALTVAPLTSDPYSRNCRSSLTLARTTQGIRHRRCKRARPSIPDGVSD
jgi:hypothetical protein